MDLHDKLLAWQKLKQPFDDRFGFFLYASARHHTGEGGHWFVGDQDIELNHVGLFRPRKFIQNRAEAGRDVLQSIEEVAHELPKWHEGVHFRAITAEVLRVPHLCLMFKEKL